MRSVGLVASLLVLASFPLSNGAPLEGRANRSRSSSAAPTTTATSTFISRRPPAGTLTSSGTSLNAHPSSTTTSTNGHPPAGTPPSSGTSLNTHPSSVLSSGSPSATSSPHSFAPSGTLSSSAAVPSGSAASCAHLPRAKPIPPRSPNPDQVAVPNAYLVAFDKTKDMTKHLGDLNAFIKANAGCASIQSKITGVTNNPKLKLYYGVFDSSVVHWIQQQKSAGVSDVAQDYYSEPEAVQEQPDASWALARISQKTKLTSLGTTGSFVPDFVTRVVAQDWKFKYDDTWGTGVLVYIVDTGVLITHNDFEGRAEKGWAIEVLGGQDRGNVDTTGHGTAVAAVVAGKKYGVAKKAKVIPIKISVNGKEEETSQGQIAEGFGLALSDFQSRKKTDPNAIGIINISWTVWDGEAVEAAITAAIEEGMHIIMSAGNKKLNQCDERAKDVGQFIVGGIDFEDQHNYNWGPCIHVNAPAVRVNSAGITSNDAMSKPRSGTSLAAPHVAGVIAAVASSKGNKSPADMRTLILEDYVVKNAGIIFPDGKSAVDVLIQSPLSGTGTAQ